MSNFLTSSIGKKFIMSITGLFLVSFLCVHLTINFFLMFGDGTLYNEAAHFMGTNPVMKVLEPILALGFIIHIIYSAFLTLENQKARPVKYKKQTLRNSSTWQSRNMFILGSLVFVFLVLHIIHFFWEIKFGHPPMRGELEDVYKMVYELLVQPWYAVLYIAGSILLGLHLSHGFWSAFQTVGWSGTLWRGRLTIIAYIFATLMALGFAIIPIVLMLK